MEGCAGRKSSSLRGGVFRRVTVLLAGVLFAGFFENKRGRQNSLTAFQSFRVNHIVHAESPSLTGYQANCFQDPEMLGDRWLTYTKQL